VEGGTADLPVVTQPDLAVVRHDDEPAPLPLWHVRVTMGGEATDPEQLRMALERLCLASPFLAGVRYDATRAEITYWDEAEDADDAAALALRVWSDHRRGVGLPNWHVVGLEVVDRDTRRARVDRPGAADGRDVVTGGVRPF
jgi:hypothetical protein